MPFMEYDYENSLMHYGVKGMKWKHKKGVNRYQKKVPLMNTMRKYGTKTIQAEGLAKHFKKNGDKGMYRYMKTERGVYRAATKNRFGAKTRVHAWKGGFD